MSIGILTRVSGLVSQGLGNIPKAAAQSDVGKGTFQKDFAEFFFFPKSVKAPSAASHAARPSSDMV